VGVFTHSPQQTIVPVALCAVVTHAIIIFLSSRNANFISRTLPALITSTNASAKYKLLSNTVAFTWSLYKGRVLRPR
jgi:hypothetical protein